MMLGEYGKTLNQQASGCGAMGGMKAILIYISTHIRISIFLETITARYIIALRDRARRTRSVGFRVSAKPAMIRL
jgi:hypothetical protein